MSSSGTDETSGSPSKDLDSRTAFALAPRFGYVLSVNQLVGVWFKGGITYFTASTESKKDATTTITNTLNGFALDLEPALVLTPVQHFGFTISGIADIGLGGNLKQENSANMNANFERTSKVMNFGLALGLLGHI